MCEFYTIRSLSFFCLGTYIYIYPVHEWFWHCKIIISVFVLLYMCMHWYVCVCFSVYSFVALFLDNFVMYLYSARVVLPLRHPCICVCINIFMNNISEFAEICMFTLYNIILGWNPSWETGCIFSDLLCHCCNPQWPAFIVVD